MELKIYSKRTACHGVSCTETKLLDKAKRKMYCAEEYANSAKTGTLPRHGSSRDDPMQLA